MKSTFSIRGLLIATLVIALHISLRSWSVSSGNLGMLSGIPFLLGIGVAAGIALTEWSPVRCAVLCSVTSVASILALLIDMKSGMMAKSYRQSSNTDMLFAVDTGQIIVSAGAYAVIGMLLGWVVGLIFGVAGKLLS